MGATAGGVLTAVAAWVVSGFTAWWPGQVRLVLLVGIAAVLLLRQAGVIAVRLPQNARQVPQAVYLRSPVVANAQFGFEMGTGMRTLVTAVAPYLLLALLVLFPPTAPWTVLGVGAVFGFVRGLVPVLWSSASWRGAGARAQWDAMFTRSRTLIGWIALLTCGAGATLVVLSHW
ncbi:MAG TPA: hypothetical protein VF755_15115 [Catenuloplanes sp.]